MNTPPRLRQALWILGFAAFLVAAWYLLDHVPQQTASQIRGDTPARLEALNAARATGSQILLSAGIFFGLYLTLRRIRATERQAKSAEDGQITERFTRAIEQLGTAGEDKVAIRLGGIYALERILRDSESDAPTVQEVLAAFVREELALRTVTQTEPADESARGSIPVPLDIDLKAAFAVLVRNPLANRRPDLQGTNLARRNLERLDLSGLDFSGADISGANLFGANLTEANLTDAHLCGTRLLGAILLGAILTNADLTGAYLKGADLFGADLFGADLSECDLTDARLTGVNLTRADLTDVDLEGANLFDAIGADLSRVSRLPDGSRPPARDPDAQ